MTDTLSKYDVFVNVNGGGFTGQSGAIRHGISRALLKADAELRPALKAASAFRSALVFRVCAQTV